MLAASDLMQETTARIPDCQINDVRSGENQSTPRSSTTERDMHAQDAGF